MYVAAEVKADGLVYFQTDSDAMITKGLAGLLSMGLSGNTPESIQTVKPEFIKVAGLHASLTAGCVAARASRRHVECDFTTVAFRCQPSD